MMFTNKVFQTLQRLDAPVIRRLYKFLQSPYFNKSELLPKLCEILIKAAARDSQGFDKDLIWKALHPDLPYDDVNFRKYCSDLLNLIEVFFAHENLENNRGEMALQTLGYVVQNKVEPLYNSAARGIQKILEKNKFKTGQHYLSQYRFEQLYYELKAYDLVFEERSNVEALSESLDFFYFIQKIKLYNAVLSQQRMGSFQYTLRLTDVVQEVVAEAELLEADSELAVRYHSLQILLNPANNKHYYALKDILLRYAEDLPHKEAVELFDAALHYCTGQVNSGKPEFSQEYLEVFESAMRYRIFLDRGELAAWRFNNTVAMALRLGKLEWAEQFVKNNKQHLPQDTRENTYIFSLSRVFLYQKKYGEVLEVLRNVEYEDIGYSLISKVILAISYFELDEYETLDSFLESFRVFLNRHREIAEQRQRSYMNFVKFTRRLMRVLPGEKEAAERLRNEIENARAATVNFDWLMEKAHELG